MQNAKLRMQNAECKIKFNMHNVTILLTLGGLHKVEQLLKALSLREQNGTYCKAPSERELDFAKQKTEGACVQFCIRKVVVRKYLLQVAGLLRPLLANLGVDSTPRG